jgi:hypothetical protein
MRFLDYNGNGGLDPQDITTSEIVNEATHDEKADGGQMPKNLESNAGYATTAVFIALSALIMLLAL